MKLEDVKNIATWADNLSHEYGIGINVIVNRFVTLHRKNKSIEEAKKAVELELQRKAHEGKQVY